MAIGRVSGHRGNAGELTVRVRAGDAERWTDVTRVWIGAADDTPTRWAVRASRAYRDRLVLALEGLDDASRAAQLRGATVEVADADRPALAEGNWFPEDIDGMAVVDEAGTTIGTATGLWPTGGVDLLRVRPAEPVGGDDELLVPLAPDFVLEVAVDERRIVVRIPDDLRTLNARGA